MAESKTQSRRPAKARTGEEATEPAKASSRSSGSAKSTPKAARSSSSKRPRAASKSPKAAASTKAAPKGGRSAAKAAKSAGAAPKGGGRTPARRKVVEQTARRLFEAVSAREPAAVAALWRDDGIYDSVPVGVFRGPEAIRRHYEEMFGAMPDMRISIERVTADDRGAAVQWRSTGSFTGTPFRGLEATGRTVELRGIDCLEIEDGSIVRNTSVYDGAAAARGMGLLPAEDSGADRALRAGLNTVTKLRRVIAGRSEDGQ